jgi:hypothetical protein
MSDKRRAVRDQPVHGLARPHRPHHLLEEVVLATHNVDVRALERLAHDPRMRLGHVLLDPDRGQFDVAFLGEPQPEFLVLLAGLVQQFHRLGLLLDPLRLGHAARLDARRRGHFLVLVPFGFGLGLFLRDLGRHVALRVDHLGLGQTHLPDGRRVDLLGAGLGGDHLGLGQSPAASCAAALRLPAPSRDVSSRKPGLGFGQASASVRRRARPPRAPPPRR